MQGTSLKLTNYGVVPSRYNPTVATSYVTDGTVDVLSLVSVVLSSSSFVFTAHLHFHLHLHLHSPQ